MACGSYSGAERSELPRLATDASLGYGNPVALATLSPGEVVLDLGSGGGIYPTAAFEDAGICVREFERYFDAGQSKVSYHLGKLKEARLVHEERRGKWGFYSLDPTAAGLFRGMARDRFEVLSAGTEATRDKPEAILVMAEIGVDISAQESETLDRYLGESLDLVIAVCDGANEACPVFAGASEHLHWSSLTLRRPPVATKSACGRFEA
jgi:DNA-binding transcriptional ArsR family regulator